MFVSIDIVKHFRITSSKSTSSTKFVPREKAFVLAAHVTPRTPKILGVVNWHCNMRYKSQIMCNLKVGELTSNEFLLEFLFVSEMSC